MADSPAPALKDMLDRACFQDVAAEMAAIYPAFDRKKFLAFALLNLDELSLMQRLRRMTESLHATLPQNYPKALRLLRELAPRLKPGFATLFLPEFVGLYGQDHFDASMAALAFFTTFGSSEFAVREFLRRDMPRTLAVMQGWSLSEDEHVRRLASEGCRPRLPWSFRLPALIKDPAPVLPILNNLLADPSLYVRKSVANHWNDITKDHPQWVLDQIATWPLENRHTAWIAKRALRTLIKHGDTRALGVIGAGDEAEVEVRRFHLEPRQVTLGGSVNFSFDLASLSSREQRLVVDYTLHYVKKAGGVSPKVFKLKELSLGAGEVINLRHRRSLRDFTTRVHYAGNHELEVMVNGKCVAKSSFVLTKD